MAQDSEICQMKRNFHHALLLTGKRMMFSPLPVGCGSTYCLLMSASASASASHQLLREPLLKYFLGGMFFVPQGIGFCFLTSCESVFHQNGFFPNFVKSTSGILIKRVRQVAHDLIIVDLQLTYFCIYYVVLKLPIL